MDLNLANEKRREIHQQCIDLKQQNTLQRERLSSCQKENESIKEEVEKLRIALTQMKKVRACRF